MHYFSRFFVISLLLSVAGISADRTSGLDILRNSLALIDGFGIGLLTEVGDRFLENSTFALSRKSGPGQVYDVARSKTHPDKFDLFRVRGIDREPDNKNSGNRVGHLRVVVRGRTLTTAALREELADFSQFTARWTDSDKVHFWLDLEESSMCIGPDLFFRRYDGLLDRVVCQIFRIFPEDCAGNVLIPQLRFFTRDFLFRDRSRDFFMQETTVLNNTCLVQPHRYAVRAFCVPMGANLRCGVAPNRKSAVGYTFADFGTDGRESWVNVADFPKGVSKVPPFDWANRPRSN